ncbi:MAG: hypothetical protein K2Y08_06075 [Alphaproteobacteria bacterium]|nr:hypothetical protein [Alphaproteobacteria bacterium]MBY0500552.1 hypothetical protein [Alphaproteobacteria bacterium]
MNTFNFSKITILTLTLALMPCIANAGKSSDEDNKESKKSSNITLKAPHFTSECDYGAKKSACSSKGGKISLAAPKEDSGLLGKAVSGFISLFGTK